MKFNKELNQQLLNTAVDKKGRPTIDIDKRKSIYNSISEALKAIPITNRNVGLTISIYNGIKVIEYWWEKGIKDSDLVKKINTDDIPRIDAKLVDLQNQINGINNIEFKIFDTLPELGDSSIIYVVPNTTSQEDDDFIEYFWIKSQQRYERFGGLNVDGSVTINNFYTFDNNVFNIDEESYIKNVSLNSKKIIVDNNYISIYKYDIGEENNERQIFIGNYSRTVSDIITNGGHIILNGHFSGENIETKDFEFILNPDSLNIKYTQDETINNIFEVNETKLYTNTGEIKLYSSTSFDINYNDDYGIKGFSDNNVEKLLLYSLDNQIVITDNNIELNIAGDSYIYLNYDTFNATVNQLIYLNAPTTKVKKVLFEQNFGSDIYLEPYHEIFSNVTYHGLKSESNIYIKDTNSYFVKSQSNYSLTSYGLNGIKHRDSNRSTSLGYDILNIGDDGVLSLGIFSELTINNNAIILQQDDSQLGAHLLIDRINNEISLQKGRNTDKFIKIDTNSNIILKGVDGSNFTINSYGHCIINGCQTSKIGLLGENNVSSYFSIEESHNITPDVNIHQNQYNYITLYKLDEDNESHITIKSEYFNYINHSNKSIFSINSDDDILFNPSGSFIISKGTNSYNFILDSDGIAIGKSNKINIDNNGIYLKLGSKAIILTETGISDGTNTKTWAQIFS